MMVKWRPSSSPNVDYIMNGCTKYLEAWDVNVERKAGGFNPLIDLGAQHFTLTNMSSLLRLICEAWVHIR